MSTGIPRVPVRRFVTASDKKIQPHHQTTGVARMKPTQFDAGGRMGTGIEGIAPLSAISGIVKTSATQKRRRMSDSVHPPMPIAAIIFMLAFVLVSIRAPDSQH